MLPRGFTLLESGSPPYKTGALRAKLQGSHGEMTAAHGYRVIFHSDGNKWPILDEIIAMGVDVIDPCESLATMEVKRFRETYPDTTVASPIDCQALLTTGTKEEVADACWQVIEDSGGRHVLTGSTSEIHPSVPIENALTMYRSFRDYPNLEKGVCPGS